MEIPVFHKGNVCAKSPDLPEQVSSHDQAGDPKTGKRIRECFERVAFNSNCLLIVSSVNLKTANVHTGVVHQACVGETGAAFILKLFECSHLPFQFFRNPDVIRIQKSCVFASGFGDSCISRNARTLVRLLREEYRMQVTRSFADKLFDHLV